VDLKSAVAFGGLVAAAIVAAVCIRADAAPLPGGWRPEPASYGMTSTRTDVRMSDGVSLSATVTRPTDPATGRPAAGRFPVVLAITPYSKDNPVLQGVPDTPAADFVPYGYVYAMVDVRGTGSSGGSFELLGQREVRDDVELVQWASRLAGANGRVGMVGASYLGLDQLFTAAAVGPGSPLKAIFPIVVGSDMYRELAVPGGMFNNLFDTPYAALFEVTLNTLGPLTAGHGPQQTGADLGQHLSGSAETDGRTASDAFDGGDRAYDQAFWRERDVASAIARIPANGIPVFAYNALFDIWQRGDPLVFSILQNAAAGRGAFGPMPAGAHADPRFQVALGPYTHSFTGPQLPLLALEWLDTWLKDRPTGMATTAAPLHAYEIGGRRWTDTTTWPPPGAQAMTLYFGAPRSGSGAPSLNDGALVPSPPTPAAFDRLRWNGGVNVPCSRATDQELVNGPVKGFGDTYGNRWENPCTYDDRGLEVGALTYTTRPLQHELTIAGPADVAVYAAANTSNTEWVVTLDDVAPGGAARPLATGDLIGSLRAVDRAREWTLGGHVVMPWHPFTRASEQPVEPGKVERYDIELPATVARIAAGHRIRITVQSSYRPYLEPTMPDQEQLVGGTYGVERGRSSATLTVVSPGALATSAVDWGACVTDCGAP
jgi:putative CocE/NonD family hydrolase